MSMFISKLLSRNSSKTKQELLIQYWSSIQRYYETAEDALKDAVDLTPIPGALQNIIKLIQAEELEYQRMYDTLETGPCLEYLLQSRVLEELAEFAKVDTPFGMRIHCLRFFCSLVSNVHAQLLPDRAVHEPLNKLVAHSHRLVMVHYEQMEVDPDVCTEERHAAIAELSLELVRLMHGVFSHFKGSNAALMDLFFERGWCRGRGERVWRISKDGKTSHKLQESMDEKIQWNVFLMPRFDMFSFLIDFMNIPGETGEIAREAILFALRLLEGDPEYVCYVVEYSSLCEVIAERLAILFAMLPKNMGSFTISSNNRVVPVRPPRRRIQFSIPAVITNNSLMIAVNAHHSIRRKRRKKSAFDTNFIRTLETTCDDDNVDHFYSFWEYLNDVARVADKRLMTALMAQLTTSLWHPVVCTALSSPAVDAATAATGYATEMIRSLTDQVLLHAFLVVLMGEEGGIGKDLEPEKRPAPSTSTSSTSRRTNDDENDDNNDNASEKSAKRDDASEKDDDNDSRPSTSTEKAASIITTHSSTLLEDDDTTLRLLLLQRLQADDPDLSLATLRLFDTFLETYNQFIMYNLFLRNYIDINPDGKYAASSLHSPTIDDDKKPVKVRWIVERILSLLPLEDELERMNAPLSVMMTRDGSNGKSTSSHSSHSSSSHHGMHPGHSISANSYDDYFHEARERFQFGILAHNFWHLPYPPPKSKQDAQRDKEDRAGRPKRPKSMVVGREAARLMMQSTNDASKLPFSASSSNLFTKSDGGGVQDDDPDAMLKRCEAYEGLFLQQIFGLFSKMLEAPVEQNLLVTSILQKIAGVVDRRVDGVICDWRAIRIGEDGSFFGGVWTLPTTTTRTRQSLYALLEKVTFEALKRAQLVPNFETRISLAKKRGIPLFADANQANNASFSSFSRDGTGHPSLQQHHHQHPLHQVLRSTASALHLTPSQSTPRESTFDSSSSSSSSTQQQQQPRLAKQASLSQLFHSSAKHHAPLPSPPSPSPSKSVNLATQKPKLNPLDVSPATLHHPQQQHANLQHSGELVPAAASPSGLFFQQKTNATPITMTNPYAKLSNFVHAYIVLQEFCKELAAVVLVRHSSAYPDDSAIGPAKNARQTRMVAWQQDAHHGPHSRHGATVTSPNGFVLSPSPLGPAGLNGPMSAGPTPHDNEKRWRQRMSVATMTTHDWKQSFLDPIDEKRTTVTSLG
ncbi:Retinoic acid induced 16-like protein-domain-containing protein [Gongronella butleri]|nr:Retinoic acid induced 16-like protein-domain-containing protein [Gongronella butleri]